MFLQSQDQFVYTLRHGHVSLCASCWLSQYNYFSLSWPLFNARSIIRSSSSSSGSSGSSRRRSSASNGVKPRSFLPLRCHCYWSCSCSCSCCSCSSSCCCCCSCCSSCCCCRCCCCRCCCCFCCCSCCWVCGISIVGPPRSPRFADDTLKRNLRGFPFSRRSSWFIE